MSKFSVSYVYELVDKYSRSAERIAGKTDRMKSGFDRASKSAADMGAKMQKVGAIMSAAVTLPIALMAKSAIQAASDAEETRSKYATVFKELGQGAETTADNFAKNFGLAGSSARKLLGDTGDMLSGFGFTSDAALKLSKRTNELAVDLASFTNFSGGAEGASAALTKALLGERESVKSLGIAILESDVKKKIAQMRSEGVKFATDREAKAYATLEIAISQSKNAIGDYARTKMAFANVQRRVSERNLELRESFGRILLPSVTKAMLQFEEFQEKLIALDEPTKKLIMKVAAFVAALAPLILVLGTIGMIAPFVAAGFSLLLSPVLLIGVAMAALIGVGYYLGQLLVTLGYIAFNLGKIAAIYIKDGFIGAFDAVKSYLLSWVDWFGGVFDGILNKIEMIKGLNPFGGDDIGVNVAAQGAANQNTLNGQINVSASGGASVDSASFGTTAPSNLGTNVSNGGM